MRDYTVNSKLLPLKGAISSIRIWHVFDFPVKDGQFVVKNKKRNEVTRKLCSHMLQYALNAANMQFPLQTHHHRKYAAMEHKKEL